MATISGRAAEAREIRRLKRGGKAVLVAPVTHRPPDDPAMAVEIPPDQTPSGPRCRPVVDYRLGGKSVRVAGARPSPCISGLLGVRFVTGRPLPQVRARLVELAGDRQDRFAAARKDEAKAIRKSCRRENLVRNPFRLKRKSGGPSIRGCAATRDEGGPVSSASLPSLTLL